MAHELGHTQGFDHPGLLTLDGWLDVMAAFPLLRGKRDRHGLLEKAGHWLSGGHA